MYLQKHSLPVWKAAMLGLLLSIVANLIILFSTKPFVIAFAPLSVSPVLLWTTIGFLGAWGTYALIRRFVQKYNHDFVAISVLVLLLSFIPDIFVDRLGAMFAGSTSGAIAVLMMMHVVEAGIAIFVFTRLARLREYI